jgi:hypothetical protein
VLKKNFILYGLGRSGTNFTKAMLEKNFHVHVNQETYGNKHDHFHNVNMPSQNVIMILCVKNPYHWLNSLHRYTEKEVDISTWLRKPNVLLSDHNGVKRLTRTSNPIQRWNNYNFHWNSVEWNNKIVVRHEDFLNNWKKTLEKIGNKFDLKEKNNTLQTIDRVVKPHSGDNLILSNEFFNSKKINYTDEDIKYINSELDEQLMCIFNYEFA